MSLILFPKIANRSQLHQHKRAFRRGNIAYITAQLIGWLLLLSISPSSLAKDASNEAQNNQFRELSWDDLMPVGWVPPEFNEPAFEFGENFKDIFEPLDDKVEEEVPMVKALDNQKVRLPGYIIPIKFDEETVTEFLLVPYVGACIHVPPPPANQMVYIKLKTPISSGGLWDPVWVSGTIKIEKSETEYAAAGYTMSEAATEKYVFEPPPEEAK